MAIETGCPGFATWETLPDWQTRVTVGGQTFVPVYTEATNKSGIARLKETWAKLEKGDYDWAHRAMNYWPDRVREKCKTDKSMAIAHGLEHLYVEPEAQPKKTRGRKKSGGDE